MKQKTEEPKLIFYPRCNTPNEPDAILCRKCKSVLKLEDAVCISDLHTKLKSQYKLVHRLKFELNNVREMIAKITAAGGLPDWQTDEGARKFIEQVKKDYTET